MSVKFKVLGEIFDDNAVLIEVNSGQKVSRLLFDCGEKVLSNLSTGEIHNIEHLFFSHYHMDHISGFDTYFRHNFDRNSMDNHIWGPVGSTSIFSHRFQSFCWNLTDNLESRWIVNEISEDTVSPSHFLLSEKFSKQHDAPISESGNIIIKNENFQVESVILEHLGPSIGYLIRENSKFNIDAVKMKKLDLKPGKWINEVKSLEKSGKIIIGDKEWDLDNLRKLLLSESSGESIAVLTDFILNKSAFKKLIPFLQNVDTLVCESQYFYKDLDLARKNYHCTAKQVAKLAKLTNVKKLVLYHLSRRISPNQTPLLLKEAKDVFQNTIFPSSWKIGD